ncbi:TPA: hypothetical protein ACMDVU_003226 [Vibrio parahaemolyticus]|uniref:hypothetical protein n=1 Tax=Vibrio parahaemolyticus TaxID=670 RepID=UPI00215EEA09|nr:hypothetical protein [Vibrio parahaemolyticus]EIO4081395.1 hypothetical protein [Vibrio parahaemolyticus]ELA7285648.1 hypothetical protein [Vibrio parahaemolyticus]MCS0143231.1 hypothetical protein [Vibrio parahaemolyticus]
MTDNENVYDFISQLLDANTQQLEMLTVHSNQTAESVSDIANKIGEVNKVVNSVELPTEARLSLKVAIVDIIDNCKKIMEQDNNYTEKVHRSNKQMLDQLVKFLEDSSSTFEGDSNE